MQKLQATDENVHRLKGNIAKLQETVFENQQATTQNEESATNLKTAFEEVQAHCRLIQQGLDAQKEATAARPPSQQEHETLSKMASLVSRSFLQYTLSTIDSYTEFKDLKLDHLLDGFYSDEQVRDLLFCGAPYWELAEAGKDPIKETLD